MLSAPDARFPEFAAELADVEATIADSAGLPRLFLLEEEYRRAVLSAQLTWTTPVVADLRGNV